MKDNWTLINSKNVVNNRWLKLECNSYQTALGQEINDYYVLTRSDFVLIVAEHGDQLVLVRQYRPATDRHYVAVPAGFLDHGETPVEAAARELREETAFAGSDFRIVGQLDPMPGYLRSRAFIVHCVAGDRTSDRVDEEVVEVLLTAKSTCLDWIRTGKLNEMQSVSAILLALQQSAFK